MPMSAEGEWACYYSGRSQHCWDSDSNLIELLERAVPEAVATGNLSRLCVGRMEVKRSSDYLDTDDVMERLYDGELSHEFLLALVRERAYEEVEDVEVFYNYNPAIISKSFERLLLIVFGGDGPFEDAVPEVLQWVRENIGVDPVDICKGSENGYENSLTIEYANGGWRWLSSEGTGQGFIRYCAEPSPETGDEDWCYYVELGDGKTKTGSKKTLKEAVAAFEAALGVFP